MSLWFKNLTNVPWIGSLADHGDDVLLTWRKGNALEKSNTLEELVNCFTDNEQIFSMLQDRNIKVRNSSVKWEKLSANIINALQKSGITGLTVAPETGSERLRKAMKKPVLFLHSNEDVFSKPEKAEVLYNLCPSKNKKLVWFDKGIHSRIRINNTEKYDNEIVDFLKDV